MPHAQRTKPSSLNELRQLRWSAGTASYSSIGCLIHEWDTKDTAWTDVVKGILEQDIWALPLQCSPFQRRDYSAPWNGRTRVIISDPIIRQLL